MPNIKEQSIEIYDESQAIIHDENICENCQNKDIDCDHCTRNEFYEEPSDCYLPKDEDEENSCAHTDGEKKE